MSSEREDDPRGVRYGLRIVAALVGLLFVPGDAAAQGSDLDWAIGRTTEVHDPTDPNLISTRIGGWVDASYQDNDLDGTTRSINLDHLNLYLDTRWRDRMQLFLEVEFENEPAVTGFEDEREYEIEQIYARYTWSDRLSLRVGQFNTPIGYWTPIHWSILMDTIRPPLHEGYRAIPEQQIGAELSGRLFPGTILGRDVELDYALYSGYGGSHDPFEQPGTKGLSHGIDLRLLLEEHHMLGTTYYVQRNAEQDDRTERNWMIYGQATLPGRITWRTEYLHQMRDRHAQPSLSPRIHLAYTALRWDALEKAYLAYRFDFGDDDTTGATIEQQVHTFTLGLRPHRDVRIKLEWSDHDFRDPGRRGFQFWGVSVGYLF
jgi:hypothetical protein